MTTIQRVARNTAVLFSAQALNYLLAFFYMMYTARFLGVAGFGVLSFAIALAAIFGLLADLGLRTLTVREVARDKSLASKYVVNVTLIKVALAAVTFGLIALSVNLMGYPPQAVKVVYLLGLSVITLAFTQVFYSIFQAFERMEYISLGQVLNASLMLVGVILAMHYGLSIVGFALLFLLARAVELVYAVAVLKFKFAGQPAFSRAKTFEIDPAFWKQSLRAAWPMGAMAIGIMIYFRIDTVMLSLMIDDAAVGLYNAGYRLMELSTIIPSMFAAAAFPVMSQFHTTSGKSFTVAYEKSVKYLFAVALPMALIVTLLAGPIVNLVYGSEFAESAGALRVLIWASALMYVTMVMGIALISANKQMLSLKVVIASAILNVVLNLIVIPRYGYIGASATTVATEAFGLLVTTLLLARSGYGIKTRTVYLPPLIGLCAALAVAFVMIHMGVNIYIISVVVFIVYFPLVYRMVIKDDDRQLIKALLNVSGLKARWRRRP